MSIENTAEDISFYELNFVHLFNPLCQQRSSKHESSGFPLVEGTGGDLPSTT